MRRCVAFFFVILGLSISEKALDAASAPAKSVIAHAAVNARVLPLWAAKEQGFFSKYGVPTEMIFIRQAPTLVAALTSGDIQIGDTVWMGAILALEHFGLDPNRDKISLIAAGDQSVLAQALVTGTIDATVLDGVMSRTLRENGYPILAELSKANLPISSVGIVAKGSYIQSNSQTIENLLKALLESEAFIFGPSNKGTAMAILKRHLRINDQEAEEGYKDVITGLDRKPFANLAGLRNVQRLMKLRNPSVEKVKVEDLVDDRFMKKLDQSGFIDEMYAKYGVK